jgi:hypothetical protein
MAGDHREHQRGVVGVVVGPVQRGDDLDSLRDHEGNPAGKEAPRVNAGVADQPVDLLHCMARVEAGVECEGSADEVDAQRRALQHAHGGVGERVNALGVQVVGEDDGNELRDAVAVEGMVAHEASA